MVRLSAVAALRVGVVVGARRRAGCSRRHARPAQLRASSSQVPAPGPHRLPRQSGTSPKLAQSLFIYSNIFEVSGSIPGRVEYVCGIHNTSASVSLELEQRMVQ